MHTPTGPAPFAGGEPAEGEFGSDLTGVAMLLARRELVGDLCHEIRTPLASILGFAELLERDGDFEHVGMTRRDAVHRIKKNGARLLAVLDRLLERLQTDAAPWGTAAVFSPVEFVERLRCIAEPQAARRGIEFELELATGLPPWIRSDPEILERILLRLLQNAIRFSEQGPVILTLRALEFAREVGIVFEVADSGPGIGADQLEMFFEPLVAERAENRSFSGRGLALSASECLARLLGGTLEAEIEFGNGTRFRLTLPDCSVPSERAPIAESDSDPALGPRVSCPACEEARSGIEPRACDGST